MGDRKIVGIFMVVSLTYLAIAATICWFFAAPGGQLPGLFWLLGLWLISLLNMTALGKVVETLMGFSGGRYKDPEKRAGAAIRTFYWGFVKLACIGFFGFILMNSDSAPGIACVLGLGTLVFVPLVGGIVWSQRVLRDA